MKKNLTVFKSLFLCSLIICGLSTRAYSQDSEEIKYKEGSSSKSVKLTKADLHCPGSLQTVSLDEKNSGQPFSLDRIKVNCTVVKYSESDGTSFSIRRVGGSNLSADSLVFWSCTENGQLVHFGMCNTEPSSPGGQSGCQVMEDRCCGSFQAQ